MMRLIAQYPRLIEQAALNREPHRLAFYLYDDSPARCMANGTGARMMRPYALLMMRIDN